MLAEQLALRVIEVEPVELDDRLSVRVARGDKVEDAERLFDAAALWVSPVAVNSGVLEAESEGAVTVGCPVMLVVAVVLGEDVRDSEVVSLPVAAEDRETAGLFEREGD